MSTDTLWKLTGGALIASFPFSLLGGVTHPVVDGHAHSVEALTAGATPWPQLAIFVGSILLMIGLPGAFAWLAPRTGRLALIGLGGYFVFNALAAMSHLIVEAFVAPTIANDPGARHLIADNDAIFDSAGFQGLQIGSSIAFLLSLLVLGIGLLRSRAVPRWIGWVFVAAAIVAFAPLPAAPVLSGLQIEVFRGLGVAALGVLMVRAARAPVAVPAERPVAVHA